VEKRSALYALLVFGSLLALCFVFLYFLFSALEQKGEQGWGSGLGPRIGIVELSGTIVSAKEIVGELHELRADFLRKAVMAGTDQVCRPLLSAGTDPAGLPGMTLGEVPPSAALQRLRERRAELGLPAGDDAWLK
jgi:hypothetical protein